MPSYNRISDVGIYIALEVFANAFPGFFLWFNIVSGASGVGINTNETNFVCDSSGFHAHNYEVKSIAKCKLIRGTHPNPNAYV